MKRVVLSLVLLVMGFSLSAQNFTIVYLDRTEVNMEAIKYLTKQIKREKLELKADFVSGFSRINNYNNPIVILNTGIGSGTDERVIQYLSTVRDSSHYILVNLYQMGSKIFFSVTEAADSGNGVDEVSAASYYKEAKGLFSKSSPTDEMHQQWTSALFQLIEEKAL